MFIVLATSGKAPKHLINNAIEQDSQTCPLNLQDIFGDESFADDDAKRIFDRFKKVSLLKGEFLLKPNEKVSDLYFVHAGCLRTYFIDPSGKEHTIQFAIKGWWISDYIALFGKEVTKSVSYIECIKEATLYRISKKDFDTLCSEIPKLGRLHIRNLESAFAAFQKRILENLTLSAKEKYQGFIRTYPNIEQSVKNYHIASYLGVTTESLSRIRKEIATQ